MKYKSSKKFAIKIVESLLVFIYIILEEVVWDIFARPLFLFLKRLIVLDVLRETFLHMNRYGLLAIFLSLFLVAEIMGIVSGAVIMAGFIFLGILIYALKIPVAAFTFWLFDLTREKLLTFQWLESAYNFLQRMIEKIVNSDIHQYIKTQVVKAKSQMRALVARYVGQGGYIASLKQHYHYIKRQYISNRSEEIE